MKPVLLAFFTALIFKVDPVFALSVGGTDVGRGGDSIALDFKSLGLYAVDFIRQDANLSTKVDIERLRKTIEGAQIEVQDRVLLNNIEKDAANYTDSQRIVISAKRWLQMASNDPRKIAIVVHEYLGLMGDSDLNYEVTNSLLATIRAKILVVPIYSCVLIQDPKMQARFKDQTRVGGMDGNSIGHLQYENIQAQLYIGFNGIGTDFLITISHGAKQFGMLELPRVGTFPPKVDLYSLDLNGMYWQVHCEK